MNNQYPQTISYNQVKNNKNLECDEYYITLNAENGTYDSTDKSYTFTGFNLNGLISGRNKEYNTDEIFICPVFFFGESTTTDGADVYLEARFLNGLITRNEVDKSKSSNNCLFRVSGEYEQHGTANHYDYFLSLQDNNNNKYLRIDPSFFNNSQFKIAFYNQQNVAVPMIFGTNPSHRFIMQFKIVIYRKD